eukprot:12164321-Alexandrium_andersonii.AAC.1
MYVVRCFRWLGLGVGLAVGRQPARRAHHLKWVSLGGMWMPCATLSGGSAAAVCLGEIVRTPDSHSCWCTFACGCGLEGRRMQRKHTHPPLCQDVRACCAVHSRVGPRGRAVASEHGEAVWGSLLTLARL